jgi:hypothetical protein
MSARITATAFLLIGMACSVLLLVQPASGFSLERTTSTSTGVAAGGSCLRMEPALRAQHQSDCCSSKQDTEHQQHQQQRRQVLQTISRSTLSLSVWGLATTAASADEIQVTPTVTDPATATATVTAADRTFSRRTDQYAYQFTPPPNFTPGNKPLKTHLDENNFKSTETAGFQFGITVDPVRLQSLSEFGTPGEVAAKVVTAEVNRDGVFDVKLMQDPIEQRGDGGGSSGSDTGGTSNGLVLDYLSSGKRGDKRFVAKFFVENQKLYALTAQCKQADYETVKKELLEAVDSFRVLPTK